MSFSLEIKSELCAAPLIREMSRDARAAMLCGMFFGGKTRDKAPVIRSENFTVISAAAELAKTVFPAARRETRRLVNSSGSLFSFEIKPRNLVFERFGDLSSINAQTVGGDDASAGAFLRGIFICCGYVTDPRKEYHFELVPPEAGRAAPLADFIREHGMNVKTTLRGKTSVIYAKESELIEDFLTYIGAAAGALEIMSVKIEKDIRNRANRSVNCEVANLDKTLAASEKMCRDVELVLREAGEELSEELRETARLRLENPESSLAELCGMFEKPISRSGLNHRLQKLSKLARQLRENNSV